MRVQRQSEYVQEGLVCNVMLFMYIELVKKST